MGGAERGEGVGERTGRCDTKKSKDEKEDDKRYQGSGMKKGGKEGDWKGLNKIKRGVIKAVEARRRK